jgi:ABC-type Na+ efflux pump permease subunit
MGMSPILLYILFGVFIFFVLVYLLGRKGHPIPKAAKTINFALLMCNLFLIAVGLALTVWGITITTGTNKVTPNISSGMTAFLNTMTVVLSVIFGLGLAACALLVFQLYKEWWEKKRKRRNDKREEEIRKIANDIWRDEGCPNGRSAEHWLKAEVIWEESKEKRK